MIGVRFHACYEPSTDTPFILLVEGGGPSVKPGNEDGCKEEGFGFLSSTTFRIKPERPGPEISVSAGSMTCLTIGLGLLIGIGRF